LISTERAFLMMMVFRTLIRCIILSSSPARMLSYSSGVLDIFFHLYVYSLSLSGN
jgi:hypothetical protein